ncbi:LLM class flavin-dependent oxidoreductase [Paenibacillus sp. P26]|nr:LLM class flavin-dependent oxidoreductase [Paenibacillus sp. P26]
MKFALFSLVSNLPNAVTGEAWTAQQKFQNILKQAVLAEELGFEAYGVGSGTAPRFFLPRRRFS